MTRDEVTKLASMAGFETRRGMVWVDQWMVSRTTERFAAFVAEAERERIKQINAPVIQRINEHLDILRARGEK